LIFVCTEQKIRGLKAGTAGKNTGWQTTKMLDIVTGRQLADKVISI
jgi:hypothetical protein